MTPERILKRVRLAGDLPYYWIRSTSATGSHPWHALTNLLGCLRNGFWPSEAWRLGLLRVDDEGAVLRAEAVSKRRMVRAQRRLNPVSWEPVLCEKSLFYAFARAAGIPVPEVYGVIYRGSPDAQAAAEHLFAGGCPSPFVVKPSLGHHGEGVRIVERTGEVLILHTGARVTAAELARELLQDGRFSAYIVQRRMSNHPTLAALAAGAGLATVRIISFMRSRGECEILHADFKIPRGTTVVSNLSLGATGNLVAELCPRTGRLRRGWTLRAGEGSVPLDRHPDTGAPFGDFQLPFWEDTRRLVMRMATAIGDVRTVGWDAVLTQDGPMLLEGNMYYDPPNSTRRAATLLRELEGLR
jgi:hypothetical protein